MHCAVPAHLQLNHKGIQSTCILEYNGLLWGIEGTLITKKEDQAAGLSLSQGVLGPCSVADIVPNLGVE